MTETVVPTAPFTVVGVVDTREFIEIEDRFVPVPGSGDARQCDRCNQIHEIHAHVIDALGGHFTVGTGCMNATTAEARKAAGRATSLAMKAARHAAAVQAAGRLAELTLALPAFPIDRVVHTETVDSPWSDHWTVDDVSVHAFRTGFDLDERMECLADSWRRARLVEAAGGSDVLWRLRQLAERWA